MTALCKVCNDRIWGLGRQGYKCLECKIMVHKRCHKSILTQCHDMLQMNSTSNSINDLTSFNNNNNNNKASTQQPNSPIKLLTKSDSLSNISNYKLNNNNNSIHSKNKTPLLSHSSTTIINEETTKRLELSPNRIIENDYRFKMNEPNNSFKLIRKPDSNASQNRRRKEDDTPFTNINETFPKNNNNSPHQLFNKSTSSGVTNSTGSPTIISSTPGSTGATSDATNKTTNNNDFSIRSGHFNEFEVIKKDDKTKLNNEKSSPKRSNIESDLPKQMSLSDFDLIKVIGRGSYAKVFLVDYKRTNKCYAMKVIKKSMVNDDEDIDWVQTEKHVFEQATNHPFLVGLHSCFQTESRLFFVIEYLCGGDLMYHMQRKRKLPEDHARFYAAEIALGLDFLHSKGNEYKLELNSETNFKF
jgi:hypothetical protein